MWRACEAGSSPPGPGPPPGLRAPSSCHVLLHPAPGPERECCPGSQWAQEATSPVWGLRLSLQKPSLPATAKPPGGQGAGCQTRCDRASCGVSSAARLGVRATFVLTPALRAEKRGDPKVKLVRRCLVGTGGSQCEEEGRVQIRGAPRSRFTGICRGAAHASHGP